jgi:hypothetical protein
LGAFTYLENRVTNNCPAAYHYRESYQLDAFSTRMRSDPFSSPRTASAVREAPNSSDAHAAEAIRPDSPRSSDSGEHDSDGDFIDDNVVDGQPVRSGNGRAARARAARARAARARASAPYLHRPP